MIHLPGILASLLIGVIPAVAGKNNNNLKLGAIGFISCLVSGSIFSLLIPVLLNLMVDDTYIRLINSLMFGLAGSVPFAEYFIWKIKREK